MAAPPLTAEKPTTYALVPPPPLPEFYLPKKSSSNDASSSTSSSSAKHASQALLKTKAKTKVQVSKQSQRQAVETRQCIETVPRPPPTSEDATDERKVVAFEAVAKTRGSMPIVTLPGADPYDVPPLAVYHICRICLRPRSARYHREHPIPINGLPPPPGICRRCRVMKVEEEIITVDEEEEEEEEEEEVEVVKESRRDGYKLVEVVTHEESNPMRLGLACFVPEENCVTGDEMKQKRGLALLRQLDGQRSSEEKESKRAAEDEEMERKVTYRHVRVQERTVSPAAVRQTTIFVPPPSPPPPKPKTSVYSTAQDAIDAVSIRSQGAMMTTAAAAATSMEVKATSKPASIAARSSTKAASVLKAASIAKAAASARASTSSPSSHATAKAKAEVAQYVFKPERTDSSIRKIAREEVERYRQAERKMEAHPDAYAHGRMVPVERRIAKEADMQEPLPWQVKEVEVRVAREKGYVKPPSAPRSRQSAPSQRDSKSAKVSTVTSGQRQIAAQAAEEEPMPWRRETIDVRVQREEDFFQSPAPRSRRAAPSQREKEVVEPALPSQRSAGSQRASRTAEVSPVSQPQGEYFEMYSGSCWSSARSRPYDEHEVVDERVVERDSQPVRSEKSSSTRRAVEQPTVQAVSAWSAAGDHMHEERDVYYEREVEYDPPPARSEKSSSTRRASERPVPLDVLELRHNADDQDSVESDKSRWPGTPGAPRRDKVEASDPAVNVSLREVLGWDNERQRYEAKEVWLPPPNRYNVVEVIEEVEVPAKSKGRGAARTDSRISDRVQELQEDFARQERGSGQDEPPLSRDKAANSWSSKPTDREYWYDGGAVRTASGHSSRFREVDVTYPRDEARDEAVTEPSTASQRTAPSQAPSHQSRHAGSHDQAPEPPGGAQGEGERVRAYHHRWAAAGEAEKAKMASVAEAQPQERRRGDADTLSRRPSAPSASARSAHSARSPEREYYHYERITQPADGPPERRLFGDHRNDYYVKTQELRRTSRPPTSIPPQPQTDTETPQRLQSGRKHHQRKAKGSPSEASTRVRFASKIEISPTPPGSEASSSNFRIVGGPGSGSKGRLLDGGTESAKDIIAEYERRGRARARDRAAPAAEERRKGYYGLNEVREREWDSGGGPGGRLDGAGAEGSGRSEVQDPRYRPRKSKPLARALSESPHASA